MKSFAIISVFASMALAQGPAVTTSAPPEPSQSCVAGSSYCAGQTNVTNIILRCDNGMLQPGNCNDNTGEPEFGALCISYAPSMASCSAVTPPSSSAPMGTGTSTPMPPPGNGTVIIVPTPTPMSTASSGSTGTGSGTAPVQTGAAAYSGVQAIGALAAALFGAAVAL